MQLHQVTSAQPNLARCQVAGSTRHHRNSESGPCRDKLCKSMSSQDMPGEGHNVQALGHQRQGPWTMEKCAF